MTEISNEPLSENYGFHLTQFGTVKATSVFKEPLHIGQVLVYKLTEDNVKQVKYVNSGGYNTHVVGQEVPLVVVRIWPDEYGPGIPGVNGQLLLDNPVGTMWVCSVREGSEIGQWRHRSVESGNA